MITWEECPTCGTRCKVRVNTDGTGRLIEVADWCRCERRRRHICLDCDQPTESSRAHRCATHRHARLRDRQNRSKRRTRANLTPEQRTAEHERAQRWRDRNRAKLRALREERGARYRANAQAKRPKPGTPEYAAQRDRLRAAYLASRDRRLEYARKYYAEKRAEILAYKAEEREMRRRIKQQKRAA